MAMVAAAACALAAAFVPGRARPGASSRSAC